MLESSQKQKKVWKKGWKKHWKKRKCRLAKTWQKQIYFKCLEIKSLSLKNGGEILDKMEILDKIMGGWKSVRLGLATLQMKVNQKSFCSPLNGFAIKNGKNL